jgi:putative peptide zinc metalloprotease protein
VLIFPYAFVDTSQAWLEPRRRRIAASAFAAYVGACFNLNPFLGRDGYQILVDVLREPNLRRRAREQFARRLARQPDAGDSRLLVRYSVLALAWSVVAVGFAVASESAREELADEQAALRSMATLVAPSVPPGEILLRSAVRPERCWMSTARASCAAWGEEVEGPA